MSKVFKNYLWVFFISMLPIIELRGAVPVGVGMGLPFWNTYAVAVVGNMLPVPFILLLVKAVLLFMQEKMHFLKLDDIATFFLEKGHKAGAKFGDAKYWALFLFVAIPMPGTGAWTGSLAASLLDLDFKKSLLAVFCGVLTAGIIMGVVSFGVFGAISTVFVFAK